MGIAMVNRYYQGLSEFHCYATRVTTGSMRLWVGTLERDMHKPANARVRLCDGSGRQVRVRLIRRADWERPFPAVSQDRFCKSFTFKGLRPGRMYRAYFERWRADVKAWEILRSASIRTLPKRLPLSASHAKPFTIALGSCHWPDHDGGRVGTAYRGLYDHPRDPHDSPDTFSHPRGKQVLSGWKSRRVNRYLNKTRDGSMYDIAHKTSWRQWVYPGTRTREYFLTITFSRHGHGSGIRMTVKGWLVRDVDLDERRKRILTQRAFRFSRKLT
ncbi:MAG: hypothetical protein F4142_09105 [Nitrospira sp. SB0675_bin_23]|nr:hypothetical protein [Nitrospira sp. SB0667_bin_9]MYH02714.1 hypothetical protein [Nitrospira sp. SB0675_bin_23]